MAATKAINLNLVLLHEGMVNKQGMPVTTSLTLIDVHDIARSSATYGVRTAFIAHPSTTLQKLTATLQWHWQEGFGASYNPNRREALGHIEVVSHLDDAIASLLKRDRKAPLLIATSARAGERRISYQELQTRMSNDDTPVLLMFGTGWGMADPLLARADAILEPLCGPTEYNHLSVRSACAIILDRLMAPN